MASPTPAAPVSAAALASFLKDTVEGEAAQDKYGLTVAAVNALVPAMATTTSRDRLELGGVMLAARLYRRRNSPEGVATFTDQGAAYVMRNDPDVAMLLGLGAYAPPVVG